MPVERCDECGFDGGDWSDEAALDRLGRLGEEWSAAVTGLGDVELQRRPILAMWSIAEYVDHVRLILSAMRFVLESAMEQPGVDLGDAPDPEFADVPKVVDVPRALRGVSREAAALRQRAASLTPAEWTSSALIAGEMWDVGWIVRHAVHDAGHHLDDVERLREALDGR